MNVDVRCASCGGAVYPEIHWTWELYPGVLACNSCAHLWYPKAFHFGERDGLVGKPRRPDRWNCGEDEEMRAVMLDCLNQEKISPRPGHSAPKRYGKPMTPEDKQRLTDLIMASGTGRERFLVYLEWMEDHWPIPPDDLSVACVTPDAAPGLYYNGETRTLAGRRGSPSPT